jgi:hypothetical protein
VVGLVSKTSTIIAKGYGGLKFEESASPKLSQVVWQTLSFIIQLIRSKRPDQKLNIS